MPVDLVCPHCQNRLAVPRRKVGVEFPCPRCGGANFISKTDAAERKAAARASRHAAQNQPQQAGYAGGFDDIGAVLDAPPGSQQASWQQPGYQPAYQQPAYQQPPYQQPTPSYSPRVTMPVTPPSRAPAGPRVNPEDLQDLILIPKQMVVLQAMLLIVLGPLAFGVGYWAASSDGKPEQAAAASGQVGGAVHLKGEVKLPIGGPPHDIGAVIIAIPEGIKVSSKFSARGLRPKDARDDFAKQIEQTINKAGGDVVRTDEQGEFLLVVKKPGRYHLLIISHEAIRQAGQPPDKIDTGEMSEYFDNVPDLLGPNRYQWRSLDFKDPMPPVTVRFE